jgi:molecular chaperone DnaJ
MVRAVVCDACAGEGKIAREPCTECRGRGCTARRRTLKVDVPAGIEDGQRIRLSGRGHAGEHGGPEGDLYVLVHVREDERFVRDGQDLVTAVDVPAPAAALGTTVQVPTLDGDTELELDPGVQPGETVTLRGRGLPPLRRGPTGDLRVIVNVLIPRRLNPEQRELLEQLHGTLTEENLRSDEGVFAKLRRVLRA